MPKVYNVYRVDYRTKTKVPVGTIVERRKSTRGYKNPLGLVKLARTIYGQSVEDQLRIVVDDVYRACAPLPIRRRVQWIHVRTVHPLHSRIPPRRGVPAR